MRFIVDPRQCARAIAVVMALHAWPLGAHAAPLDSETCQKLVRQRADLEARGAGKLIAGGAPQLKSQLSVDQIEMIRQVIALDGQIRFRCPNEGSLAVLKEDPVEEQVDTADGGTGPAGAKPAPAKPKKPTKAPAPKSAAATTADETQNAAAKTPKAPAAPKRAAQGAKADDAFRGPTAADTSGPTTGAPVQPAQKQ